MLRPLLIIGLGGSGGKTLRAIKQQLNSELISRGHKQGLPSAWQFLHIDLTLESLTFPAPMLTWNEFLNLVPPGVRYSDLLKHLESRVPASHRGELLAGWGERAPTIQVNGLLPRTSRAATRIAGVDRIDTTLSAIRSSIARMQGAGALQELSTVSNTLGQNGINQIPQVFLISSLCGTTGSSLPQDVAQLLASSIPADWGRDITSFFYTPDLFESVGWSSQHGYANAYGVTNELVAGKLGNSSPRSHLLYHAFGLSIANQNKHEVAGCGNVILIGSRTTRGFDISYGVPAGSPDQVFLAFGKMLANNLLDESASEWLSRNVFHYRSARAPYTDVTGLNSTRITKQSSMFASSLGFSQLSTGSEKLLEYVAAALTKAQVERLLWPEPISGKPDLNQDAQALVEAKSQERYSDFLQESDFNRTPEKEFHSQFMSDSKLQLLARNTVEKISIDDLIHKKRPIDSIQFALRAWGELEYHSIHFINTQMKSLVADQVREWILRIQSNMNMLVAKELSNNGYAVTLKLIEKLEHEITESLIPELENTSIQISRMFSNPEPQLMIVALIENQSDRPLELSRNNPELISKMRSLFLKMLELQTQVYASSSSVLILQDFIELFLTPIKEELTSQYLELKHEIRAHELPGHLIPFGSFPTWGSGSVNYGYKAGPLEVTLISSDSYEAIYEMCAPEDFKDSAFRGSITPVLLGTRNSQHNQVPDRQTLIREESPWITGHRDFQSLMGEKAAAVKWECKTDLNTLLERTRFWLNNPETSFGKFLSISLSDFLHNESLSDLFPLGNIQENFISGFRKCIELAHPLVTLNEDSLNRIKGSDDRFDPKAVVLSPVKLPFAPFSTLGQSCIEILFRYGVDALSNHQSWFDPEISSVKLNFVSSLDATLPAWGFTALTDPILAEVERSKRLGGHSNSFSSCYRARPLTESIPFESEVRRSIVTGWFISSFFNMPHVDSGSFGHAVKIWNSTLKEVDWSFFPDPLLQDNHPRREGGGSVLVQLLLSAGLALAKFGQTGDTTTIDAYRLLRHLGREVTTQLVGRDEWDTMQGDNLSNGKMEKSLYVQTWIQDGKKPAGGASLSKSLENRQATPLDRAQALFEVVQSTREDYLRRWKECNELPWQDIPESWELKEDIDLALKDISNYVREFIR